VSSFRFVYFVYTLLIVRVAFDVVTMVALSLDWLVLRFVRVALHVLGAAA
jgi:hypothetical protein